jgi:hypothetical protein
VPRDAGHQAEHDAQVELHGTGAEANGVCDRASVDPGHRKTIVEEHQVEAAVLEDSAQLLVEALIEEAVLGCRVPPRPRVHGDVARLHEADKRHLLARRVHAPPGP